MLFLVLEYKFSLVVGICSGGGVLLVCCRSQWQDFAV